MSLRDTIDGACKETQEAGGLSGNIKPTTTPKAEKSGKDEAEKHDLMTTKSYRSSAAGAEHSREAASTVRTASSSSSAHGRRPL
jgi:hypothetical protein